MAVKRIYMMGWPSAYGGANTERWHTIKLWRKLGLDVTVIASGVPMPDHDEWIVPLMRLNCSTVEGIEYTADYNYPPPGICVAFCDSGFRSRAAKLRELAAAHDKADWPQRLAFHLQLVAMLNSEKRFDESKADLEALLKEHPDTALYIRYVDTLLGASSGTTAGPPDKAAVEAARKILREGLDKLGRKPELLEDLALVAMRASDWLQAEAAAADLLKDEPNNVTAMAFRSDALLNKGKYDSAFEWAQKAVDRDGMQYAAMNNMAWILAEKKKEPAKALPWSDQALKIAPWHYQLLDTNGWIHYLLGDYRQAIDTLEESIRLGDSGVAHYHLGLAYREKAKPKNTIDKAEQKRMLQLAKEHLEKAVVLGEKDPAVAVEYLAPAQEALNNLKRQS